MLVPYWWHYPKDWERNWVLDNGAYSAFAQGVEFDGALFLKTLDKIPTDRPPLWIVCPDKVGQGADSLSFSLAWIDALQQTHPQYKYLLAVQEGMRYEDVAAALRTKKFVGVFVGGASKEWKLRTLHAWRHLSTKHGLLCHVGRISNFKELSLCRKLEVDSVDSSTPAQREGGWEKSKTLYDMIIDVLRGKSYMDNLETWGNPELVDEAING